MNSKKYRIISILFLLSQIGLNCHKQSTPSPNPLPPNIISFSPLTATNGDLVKIVGVHLANTSSISFGGRAASTFKIISDSILIATVDMGTSGNIMVTTNGGKKEISGFKYYTAPVFQLQGNCIYLYTFYAPTITVLKDTIENSSFQLLQMNPFDSIKNYFDDPYYKYNISPYVDSPNYVRLSGITSDANQYPLFSFQNGSNNIIYAKLIDTSLTIPKQYPYSGSSQAVSGSGSLVNNKLTLNYISEYRGYVKKCTLFSQ
jgi:hypothetical protein